MIYIDPNVDIYLLTDGKIQIRKIDFTEGETEILEISGSDSEDLSKILPFVWEKGITEENFLSFFGGKYSQENLTETIRRLKNAGVFSMQITKAIGSVEPFKAHQFLGKYYFIRVDNFLFLTRSAYKASYGFHSKIVRRFNSKSDLNILRELRKKSLRILSAKSISEFLLVKVMRKPEFRFNGGDETLTLKISQNRNGSGDLFLADWDPFANAKNLLSKFKKNSGQNSGHWGYWDRVILKGMSIPSLISSIHRIKERKDPFFLGKKLFLSTHIAADFDGRPVNDSQIGQGDSDEEACGKAIMESYERFCCEKRPSDIFEASLAELSGKKVIHPDNLAKYFKEQLAVTNDFIKNCAYDDLYFWTKVASVKGTISLIPACHIWYCFRQSDYIDGKSLFWASTNGAAAHLSFHEAVTSGARELIERDALLLWWINRLSPPRIEKTKLTKKQRGIIDKLENCGFEVIVLNITLDTLPVALAIARNRKKEKPYFFCGASCNENFSKATQKALEEMAHAVWGRSQREVRKIKPRELYSPLDHELFYLSPKNGKHLDFLFEGSVATAPREMPKFKSIQELSDYLKQKGLKLFFKNITCKELREEKSGVRVAKTVIPGLIPMTFGFMNEPLKLQRIYDIPMKLGLRKSPLDRKTVIKNYQPHFFA